MRTVSVKVVKRKPGKTAIIDGKLYHYQWSTPHLSDVALWVDTYSKQLFIKVLKYQKPGHPSGTKRGTRFTPTYSMFVRRKVTKQKPEWYRHSS